jgi:hypothetical protein
LIADHSDPDPQLLAEQGSHNDNHSPWAYYNQREEHFNGELESMDESLLRVVNSGWNGLDLTSLCAHQYNDDSFFKLILDDPKAYCNFAVVNGLIYLKKDDIHLLCIPAITYKGCNIREIIISEAHSVLAHLGA